MARENSFYLPIAYLFGRAKGKDDEADGRGNVFCDVWIEYAGSYEMDVQIHDELIACERSGYEAMLALFSKGFLFYDLGAS